MQVRALLVYACVCLSVLRSDSMQSYTHDQCNSHSHGHMRKHAHSILFTLSLSLFTADGNKRMKLSGKWNSHCDMVKCDFEGVPVPDMEPQVSMCCFMLSFIRSRVLIIHVCCCALLFSVS